MSGPITPPLTVTTVGGTPSGRPITTIKVSDGDLTISGNVATIDTSGTAGAPADAEYLLAFDASIPTELTAARKLIVGNNVSMTHGAGANDDMIINAVTSQEGSTVNGQIQFQGTSKAFDAREVFYYDEPNGGLYVGNDTTNGDATITILADGTGEPTLSLSNPTAAVSLTCDTNQKLKVEGGLNTFIFDASSATGGITWPDGTTQITAASGGGVDGSGTANTIPKWSDSDTLTDSRITEPNSYETLLSGAGGVTLVIQATDGNEPNFKLLNSSSAGWFLQQSGDADSIYWKRVGSGVKRLELASDGELTINAAYKLPTAVTGANDYVLTAQTDGSTAWAAAGGGGVTFPLEADAGSAAAPSYSFSGDTDTGIYKSGTNKIGFTASGAERMALSSTDGLEMKNDARVFLSDGMGASTPSLAFDSDEDTGFHLAATNSIGIGTAGSERFRIAADGQLGIGGANYGTDGQVLTSTGATTAPAWEDAGGGGDFNVILLEDVINSGYARYPISSQAPYGSTSVTTATYGASTTFDKPYALPFIAPESGDVSELGIEITSAAGSSCNLEVGIYSTTSTGAPDSLLGKAVFDITTTGFKYDTSLSATVTLTKSTQYWIMFVRDTSGISYGVRAVQQAFGTPTICPTDSPNPNGSCKQISLSNSDNTLPASSITLTDFYPASDNAPCLSLKIS